MSKAINVFFVKKCDNSQKKIQKNKNKGTIVDG
jgi:hypothetical protein